MSSRPFCTGRLKKLRTISLDCKLRKRYYCTRDDRWRADVRTIPVLFWGSVIFIVMDPWWGGGFFFRIEPWEHWQSSSCQMQNNRNTCWKARKGTNMFSCPMSSLYFRTMGSVLWELTDDCIMKIWQYDSYRGMSFLLTLWEKSTKATVITWWSSKERESTNKSN